MIKKEIRSFVKNTLPKYDQDAKYHDRYLDAVIEKTLNEMYNELWISDPLALQRFCKRYGGTATIAVTLDMNANVYYSTYPAKFVPFPDKASGIRRVMERQQAGKKFFPMDQREVELVASGTNSRTINTKVGYIVTADRLEYYGMTAAIAAIGVRMDVIVPFSVYEETDNVLIPEFNDDQGNTFLDRVLKVLTIVQPPDVIDDNRTSFSNESQNSK
jgi:hypothetical protein